VEKVSVVITSYNRENMIIRAIESVVNQSYKNIEIIIIDDHSKDNTKDIVNNYINENNFSNIVFLINEQNMGANYSRNRGVKISTGKYISFLDDDDEYLPTKNLMKKYNDKVIVYCGFLMYDSKGRLYAKTKFKYEGNILDKLLEDNFLGNPIGTLTLAKGKLEYGFYWTLGLLIVTPPFIYIGSFYGIIGVSWGLVMLMLVLKIPGWYFLVNPLCGAKFLEYHWQIVKPLVISSSVGIFTYMVYYLVQTDIILINILIVSILGMISLYVLYSKFNVAFLETIKMLVSKGG